MENCTHGLDPGDMDLLEGQVLKREGCKRNSLSSYGQMETVLHGKTSALREHSRSRECFESLHVEIKKDTWISHCFCLFPKLQQDVFRTPLK